MYGERKGMEQLEKSIKKLKMERKTSSQHNTSLPDKKAIVLEH